MTVSSSIRSRAVPILLLMSVVASIARLHAQDPIRVVTTLTTYAAIAREIVGDRAEVTAIADPAENPHSIQPKPSLVSIVKRADLLISTGLDLELWLPSVLDKANNPRVASGSPGFVAVSYGISLLDVPETLSRTEGEIHIYGNHHIWTEPANAIIIGNNILTGLQRVDPANASYYEERYAAWVDRIMRAYVGDELVEMLGQDLLVDLDREGELWSFLTTQAYQGRPLVERVGGWLSNGRSLRGREMACYHKQWSYFSRSFGVSCAVYIEPKPGVPPTPRHVASVISTMRERGITVLLAANYYDRDQVQMVARRTGAQAVIIPLNVDAAPNTETFIDLMDVWVDALTAAFTDAAAASNPE